MEYLPLEVLRQIAIYLPYDSVYSLSRVSRKVRLAVHDWQVYRTIIDGHGPNHKSSGNPLKQYEPDELVKWAGNPITSSTPPDQCALYARADYRCWNIPIRDHKTMNLTFVKDFVRWGGIMAARAHPFIHEKSYRNTHLHYLGYSNLDGSSSLPVEYKYIFSFWTTTFLLSYPVAPPGATEYVESPDFAHSIEEARRVIWISWSRLNKSLEPGWYIDSMEAPSPDIPGQRKAITALPFQELCVRSVGLLGYKYRLYRSFGRYRITLSNFQGIQADFHPRHSRPGPLGTEIPFQSFMKLPNPFVSGPSDFVGCHLETMTSKEFLEEGTWMGFYGQGRLQYFGAGLIDVKFRVIGQGVYTGDSIESQLQADEVVQNPEDDHRSHFLDGQAGVKFLALEGSGRDGDGEFVLRGRLYPASGRVMISKTYKLDGEVLYWTAFMTPFGIFGRWAGSLGRDYGGHIWLWKEDWYGDAPDLNSQKQS